MKKLILFFCFFIGSNLAFSYNQPDENEALEIQVRHIAHQLRCPTCQAMSVKESEAGLSNNMKAMIREMLLQGKSESVILDFFVQRYGEWILREPPKTGFNLVLWVLPGILLILALLGVLWWMRPDRSASPSAPSLSLAEKAEIEKDMKQISND